MHLAGMSWQGGGRPMKRAITLGIAVLLVAVLPGWSLAQNPPVFVPVPAGPTTPAAPAAPGPVFVPVPAQPTVTATVTAGAGEQTIIIESIAPPVPLPPLPPPQPVKQGICGRHGLGCWTTHYTLGCGSLKSECKFLFGSCRTFYGEPCLAPPPPGERPPGYNGLLPLGRPRAGCPCEQ